MVYKRMASGAGFGHVFGLGYVGFFKEMGSRQVRQQRGCVVVIASLVASKPSLRNSLASRLGAVLPTIPVALGA